MTTRKELVAALQLRYRSATFGERIRILDEFVALTAYHRKHAIRLLREQPGAAKGTRGRNRLYDDTSRSSARTQPLLGVELQQSALGSVIPRQGAPCRVRSSTGRSGLIASSVSHAATSAIGASPRARRGDTT